ncbi:MAG TPA: phosphoribosyltransferase family protein [Gaiellaceae bacterium]|nr:phosphoribosyltransferase family protein [Gaiellaceae bacterium]
MSEYLLFGAAPLFADRADAGRALAVDLEDERGPELVVVGLARGGVAVAAEVARVVDAPLDVVAVRKVGHPRQPEYALGAVTPGDGVFLRARDRLTDEQLARVIEETKEKAAVLDRKLHAEQPALDLHGKTVVVVDDGLATGATMVAALRWARVGGARRVVAALPVAAAGSLELVRKEADALVCPHPIENFLAVGVWYASFDQIDDDAVIRLLRRSRSAQSFPGGREHGSRPDAPHGGAAPGTVRTRVGSSRLSR